MVPSDGALWWNRRFRRRQLINKLRRKDPQLHLRVEIQAGCKGPEGVPKTRGAPDLLVSPRLGLDCTETGIYSWICSSFIINSYGTLNTLNHVRSFEFVYAKQNSIVHINTLKIK